MAPRFQDCGQRANEANAAENGSDVSWMGVTKRSRLPDWHVQVRFFGSCANEANPAIMAHDTGFDSIAVEAE